VLASVGPAGLALAPPGKIHVVAGRWPWRPLGSRCKPSGNGAGFLAVQGPRRWRLYLALGLRIPSVNIVLTITTVLDSTAGRTAGTRSTTQVSLALIWSLFFCIAADCRASGAWHDPLTPQILACVTNLSPHQRLAHYLASGLIPVQLLWPRSALAPRLGHPFAGALGAPKAGGWATSRTRPSRAAASERADTFDLLPTARAARMRVIQPTNGRGLIDRQDLNRLYCWLSMSWRFPCGVSSDQWDEGQE